MSSKAAYQRKRIVIDDSDSSDDDYIHSVTSINSTDDEQAPRDGNSDVEYLATSMSRVAILDPSTNNRQLAARNGKYGKLGLDSLIFDSDSDSSIEVVEPTFPAKRKPTQFMTKPVKSSTYVIAEDKASSDDDDSDSEEDVAPGDNAWNFDSEFDEYCLKSTSKLKMPGFRIPSSLYNLLFDHQKDGVAWLAGLHKQRVGGLLGDDMGMGKTYMALTYLGGLMRDKTIRNGLIIAPLSVLRSWQGEAEKVLKSCVSRVRILVVSSDIGKATRTKHLQDALKCTTKRPHLVITTYGLVGSAPLDFCHDSCSWDYVVLDEAHKIKNPSAKVSKNCRRICRSEDTRRLILTGTPIMNNLRELWALFDFATSGRVLSTLPRFVNRFAKPIEEARDKDATDHTMRIGEKANMELQQTLRPYFLQRLKIDFLADKLPAKSDFVVWTHLSHKQRNMYQTYVDSKESAVASVLSGESTSPLEAITWLKKLCGHPILVDKRNQGLENKFQHHDPQMLIRESSKLQVLVALIDRLRQAGHRTLIFSQSTRMLDIIERVLHRVRLARIDGSTKEKDRQRFVDDFNVDKKKTEVMLLSTKAAGIGLTLTGADRAIIYDPSWNPAEDSQAVDRCYRIGQTKAVVVFRLIAAGTVEEKMYEKQIHKDGIRRAVMTSTGSATTRYFDKHELRKMFTLAPAGQCEVLERLKQRGEAICGDTILSSHDGVVGISSHDGVYSAKSLGTLVNSDSPSQNPFSQNPIPSDGSALLEIVPISGGNEAEPEVLGRSQRALLGKHERKEQSGGNSVTEDPGKENINGNVDSHLAEDELGRARRSPKAILLRLQGLRKPDELERALSILMDLLEDDCQVLGKDDKVKVHERIAQIAYALGWL